METPGNALGEEIEFAAGKGTYTENEVVRASLCGSKDIDEKKRTISIKPCFATAENIKVGQRAYAVIDSVGETHAMMTIFDYEKEHGGKRVNFVSDFAMMRIEGVKSFGVFMKNMSEAVRVGDIVKVEVSKIERGGIDVIMKGKELGVVKAFCSSCRRPLVLNKDNKLFCQNCNRTEARKIASSYIEVML
ncbi:MAG: exosome complex RNA-binding protein Csl4 [Candidatus Micrarchaeota archaeon]|nr:exosome complex RNA-binding protein Csl4 [Candidatus Micrarchaeota archaeon]